MFLKSKIKLIVMVSILNMISLSAASIWTLTAVGDIMLSRTVDKKMRAYGSYLYPYGMTREHLKGDLVFANLETPLIPGPAVNSGVITFRADLENAAALKETGFTLVSLANNHSGNWGNRGFRSTFEILENEGPAYVGAGWNSAVATDPYIFEKNGFRVGVLAYSDSRFTGVSQEPGIDKPGSAQIQSQDYEAQIISLKERVDFVIISPHWGTEYKDTADMFQRYTARKMIDAGADLIVGHHPHVVENMEWYKGRLIIYSLGNFVFDQMFSLETRQGLLCKFTFDGKFLDSLELVPVLSEDYCQPVPVTGNDAEAVLNRLGLPWNEQKGHYFLTFDPGM